MGFRELREKYGRNLKGKEAVNRAIRTELLAGEAVLSAMPLLHEAARKLNRVADKDPGGPEADEAHLVQQAFDLLCECRDLMGAEVMRRYEIGD